MDGRRTWVLVLVGLAAACGSKDSEGDENPSSGRDGGRPRGDASPGRRDGLDALCYVPNVVYWPRVR